MSEEGRRHLSAIIALVAGSFVGLTLLPVAVTGPFGAWLGATLWRTLGIGALGFPLLGLGLGLAGFDRLPQLDMKRVAILVTGLAVLVPFIIGVVTGVRPGDFDTGQLPPRLTGVLPGFLAYTVVQGIGVAGGLLLGFLLLSALTIVTIAWHPLRRLVLTTEPAQPDRGRGSSAAPLPLDQDDVLEPPGRPPAAPPSRRAAEAPRKKPAKPPTALIGDPADDNQLPPIELLAAPPAARPRCRAGRAGPAGTGPAGYPQDLQGRGVHRGTHHRTGGDPVRGGAGARGEGGTDRRAGR